MKIKICGIKDPEIALFAALQGADFIGIVREPKSKRYVSLELAQEIAFAAKEGGAQSVLVYNTCKEEGLEVDFIQFYGGSAPEKYGHIYVNQPHALLRAGQDFLLFDHPQGGSGIPLAWDTLELPSDKPCMLAGGLSVDNVAEAMQKLRLFGVDVSTGVETEEIKDLEKIAAFIKKGKTYA